MVNRDDIGALDTRKVYSRHERGTHNSLPLLLFYLSIDMPGRSGCCTHGRHF